MTLCRRLMTIPGVGPVVSLAFTNTIDIPARFKNSKAVGPSSGSTPISINPARATGWIAITCAETT